MILPDVFDCYEESLGGIDRRVWYAPIDFLSLQKPTQEPHYVEDIRTIGREGIHLKDNNKLRYIDCMLSENAIVEKSVGATRRHKTATELTISIRELTARNLGFTTAIKNIPLVFFIVDNNENVWIIGTEKNPTYLTNYEANTGNKIEDDNMINLTFSTNSRLQFYNGALDKISLMKAFQKGFASGFA